MRVLQIIETGGPGGAETVFLALAAGLVSRGHEVHCATADGTWLPDALAKRQIERSRLEISGAFDMRLLFQLCSMIRRTHADIVHAHLFDGAVYAASAAQLLGVPCVVTLHGRRDVSETGWRSAIKRRLLVRSHAAVVTVSAWLRDTLRPAFGDAADQFSVIYNGVSERVGVKRDLDGAIKISERRANDVWRLAAVGNIRGPKNYPALLEAVAILRARGRDVTLRIAGEPDRGGLYESLLQQRQSLSLTDYVQFLGFVEDPTPILNQADCFILASTQEGFSLASVEAMLCGVPVIATRSGGPEEIIQHEKTGLLVPINDPEAIASAVESVFHDPSRTAAMTSAARTDAISRFGLEAMVQNYEQLYSRLASGIRQQRRGISPPR